MKPYKFLGFLLLPTAVSCDQRQEGGHQLTAEIEDRIAALETENRQLQSECGSLQGECGRLNEALRHIQECLSN